MMIAHVNRFIGRLWQFRTRRPVRVWLQLRHSVSKSLIGVRPVEHL